MGTPLAVGKDGAGASGGAAPMINVIASSPPECKDGDEKKGAGAAVCPGAATSAGTVHKSAESLDHSSITSASSIMRDVDALRNETTAALQRQVKSTSKPITKSAEDESNAASGLRELRNKIAFGLLLVNGLLVLIIYLLQINKRLLSFEFVPYQNYTWKKWDPLTGAFEETQDPLQIEPIGFTVILFLSLLLFIQTCGLVLHRWATLKHILASTELACFKRRKTYHCDGDELLDINAVSIGSPVVYLFTVQSSGSGRRNGTVTRKGRRKVIFDLERARKRRKGPRALQAAFLKRFVGFSADRNKGSLNGAMRGARGGSPYRSALAAEATARALQTRRDTLLRHPAGRLDDVNAPGSAHVEAGAMELSPIRAAGPMPELGGGAKTAAGLARALVHGEFTTEPGGKTASSGNRKDFGAPSAKPPIPIPRANSTSVSPSDVTTTAAPAPSPALRSMGTEPMESASPDAELDIDLDTRADDSRKSSMSEMGTQMTPKRV